MGFNYEMLGKKIDDGTIFPMSRTITGLIHVPFCDMISHYKFMPYTNAPDFRVFISYSVIKRKYILLLGISKTAYIGIHEIVSIWI